MELMGPEPSDIKSPNAHLQGREKKRYLGILEDLTFTITYGALEDALEGSFLPHKHFIKRQAG